MNNFKEELIFSNLLPIFYIRSYKYFMFGIYFLIIWVSFLIFLKRLVETYSLCLMSFISLVLSKLFNLTFFSYDLKLLTYFITISNLD